MMAGNPNWWSNMHPPQSALFPAQYVSVGSANSSLSLDSLQDHHHHHHLHAQDPPQSSWSQLFLNGSSSSTTTGLSEENDDRLLGINLSQFQPNKKLENWEDQMILSVNPPPRLLSTVHDHVDHHHHHHHDVKQEASNNLIKSNLYGRGEDNIHHDQVDQLQANRSGCANNWSQVIPVSSPRSCITSSLGTNNNMLNFSYNNNKADTGRNQSTDHSSECNSTATGVVCKKPRVQPSSSQPPLKVRKEKLGDRITALHQLVSPFGKTDTASVLLEAIGYIRFLQDQIEAHSSPYLGHASKNMRNNNQQYGDVEGAEKEKQKDLRSRGLCLVPVSCTNHVASDNGADYWAPSNFGSGF